MSVEMGDAWKRVKESHYPGRIREAALTRERADDQRHLAEFEEFVKKHKDKPPREALQPEEKRDETPPEAPHDILDLHAEDHPAPPAAPVEKKKPASNGSPHFDVTI